jgi:hypothetical protein
MARTNNGPFARNLYIPPAKFESIARRALEEVGLMPDSPSEVRIERFLEKKWDMTEDYVELPEDVLGQAAFDESGLHHIELNRALAEDESQPAQRRLRSTLAHEIGHGLVHAPLWAEVFRLRKEGTLIPIPENLQQSFTEFGFSCRSQSIESCATKRGEFEWWEYQANQIMATMLLPWHLVMEVANNYRKDLCSPDKNSRDGIMYHLKYDLADVFNVNPAMAQIRVRKWAENLYLNPELPF